MVLHILPSLPVGAYLQHLASNRERCSLKTANNQHLLFWTRVITGWGAFPPSQPAKLHQLVGPEPVFLRKKCQAGKVLGPGAQIIPVPNEGKKNYPKGQGGSHGPNPLESPGERKGTWVV